MRVIIDCLCQNAEPFCELCNGDMKLEVTQTYHIPLYFDMTKVRFEGIACLFQVFVVGDQVIGAGNIEYLPESNSYFVYELQSFMGEVGHKIMMNAMHAKEEIKQVQGHFDWIDCLIY